MVRCPSFVLIAFMDTLIVDFLAANVASGRIKKKKPALGLNAGFGGESAEGG
jgi:hypothetical protein